MTHQNHLQLKENFHLARSQDVNAKAIAAAKNTGTISPDFNSADLTKNRPPNKISKYASNVELKNMP